VFALLKHFNATRSHLMIIICIYDIEQPKVEKATINKIVFASSVVVIDQALF
jgi:hypothetical protein